MNRKAVMGVVLLRNALRRLAWRWAACIWATLAVTLLTSGANAQASPDGSRCYSIQNADKRHLCLAQARHDPSRCFSVRDSDQRHSCLAVTRQDRSRCFSIREGDARAMCLAVVAR
jgi:hypothetical protein